MKNPSLATLSAILEAEPALMTFDENEDPEKRRRRKMYKFIASKVLQYHALDDEYTAREIAHNVTIPTVLKAIDGSFGGLQRRIRVVKTFVPPCKLH